MMVKRMTMALASVAILGAAVSTPSPARPTAPQAIPNPSLTLRQIEVYTAGGREWLRYTFDVANKAQFPDSLFVASPGLPPCGRNANSARTWVDFFDAEGKRLYGFCALKTSNDLGTIWFSVARGTAPPAKVYIEINDRLTNTRYRSNLAATSF